MKFNIDMKKTIKELQKEDKDHCNCRDCDCDACLKCKHKVISRKGVCKDCGNYID